MPRDLHTHITEVEVPDNAGGLTRIRESRITNEKNAKDETSRLHIFRQKGFHGDPHLLQLIHLLSHHVDEFIETGTESGSSVAYLARMYPHIQCYTAEVVTTTYKLTTEALKEQHSNIRFYNRHSLRFLEELEVAGVPLFWLDAHSHGYGGQALVDELALIPTKWPGGLVLIDDFKTGSFGYDSYPDTGDLSWELVKKSLPEDATIDGPYFPAYEPRKGSCFGEKPILWDRGWVLFGFGDVKVPNMPEWVKHEADSN